MGRHVRRAVGAVLLLVMVLAASLVGAEMKGDLSRGHQPDTKRSLEQAGQVEGFRGVRQVAVSGSRFLAVQADGSLTALEMAIHADGQRAVVPQKVPLGGSVHAVATYGKQVILLGADGGVSTGEVAIDDQGVHAAIVPVAMEKELRAVAVAAGPQDFAFISGDGSVWVAAHGTGGSFRRVPDVSGAVSVAVGTGQLAVVDADGVLSIAVTESGVTSKVADGVTSVVHGGGGGGSGGAVWLALRTDGTVVSIAIDEPGVHRTASVPGLSQITALDASGSHLLALDAGGNAWVAEIAIDEPGLPRPKGAQKREGVGGLLAVAAGTTYDAALRADGTVWRWLAPEAPARVSDFGMSRGLIAGDDSIHLALLADGTVAQVGERIHVVPHVFETRSIARNQTHGFALRADGTAVAWEISGSGQGVPGQSFVLPHVLEAKSLAAGDGFLAWVRGDGTTWVAGIAIDEPGVHVADFDGARLLAADGDKIAVVKGSGQVVAGRLARDGGKIRGVWLTWLNPLPRPGKAVSFGNDYLLMLAADGSVWRIACCGDADSDGDGVPDTALQVPGATGVTAISAAASEFLTLDARGRATRWPVEAGGRTVGAGVVAEILEIARVAAGDEEHLIQRQDGSVWKVPSTR